MNKPELEILIDIQLEKSLQKVRDAYEASVGLKTKRSDELTLALDHIETYSNQARALRSMVHSLDNVELIYKYFGDKKSYDEDFTTSEKSEAIKKLSTLDNGSGSAYLRYKGTDIMVANVRLKPKFKGEEPQLMFKSLPYQNYYSS